MVVKVDYGYDFLNGLTLISNVLRLLRMSTLPNNRGLNKHFLQKWRVASIYFLMDSATSRKFIVSLLSRAGI